MLIFHKQIRPLGKDILLADSTEQRLVNTLKFICEDYSGQLTHPNENIRLTLTNFSSQQISPLLGFSQAKVTRKVE